MKKSFEIFSVVIGLLLGSMVACWASNHVEETENQYPLYLNCIEDFIYDGENYVVEYSDPDAFEDYITIVASQEMFYNLLTDYDAYLGNSYIVNSPIYSIEETSEGTYHLGIYK